MILQIIGAILLLIYALYQAITFYGMYVVRDIAKNMGSKPNDSDMLENKGLLIRYGSKAVIAIGIAFALFLI